MNSPALLIRRDRSALGVRRAAMICDHGRISPSRPILMAAILACLALAFRACFTPPDNDASFVLGVAALFAAGIMATALRPGCDLYWNADGVEGPSSMLGLPFAPRSSFIAWESVVAIGTTPIGTWFVADAQGNRISWNLAYAGAAQLSAQAARSCPHLCSAPADAG